MSDKKITFINFIDLLQKTRLFKLFFLSSGTTWYESEDRLTDFNKTLVTLSSSALVLSFSIIKISFIHVSKTTLAWSWIFFLLTIIAGVLLLYLKFIARICDRILKNRSEREEYKKGETAFDIYEFRVYFYCLLAMFLISLFEMIGFTVGLSLLVLTAYNAI